MSPKVDIRLDVADLSSFVAGGTFRNYKKRQVVFVQGTPADEVFYVKKGRIKLSVVSKAGKEAIIAIFDPGDFLGEGLLAGRPRRIGTARAMTDSSILRLPQAAMIAALRDHPEFSEIFMAHLLSRNLKIEEDLLDHLFNSSEKRLARLLLLLANFGKDGKHEPVFPKMSQETLAEMIGTTRSRVSFFMNKFRDLGFIDYNDGLEVHSSLLSVVLHD